VNGEAVAEPVAEAEADAQQYGGPGYGTYPAYMGNQNMMPTRQADNMEGYGTLAMPDNGNVMPVSGNQGFGMPSYDMSPPYSGAPVMSPPFYGAPVMSPPISGAPVMSPPISGAPVMSPPISGAPVMSPPIANNPQMPPLISQEPEVSAPVGNAPVSMPVNNQGDVYTRSFTPIQGTRCMNVCRTRPNIMSRPTCRPACNVRPSCSFNRPSIDYSQQGQTTFCRPQRTRCATNTCGWGNNGNNWYNNNNNYYYGGNGGSGFNPGNNEGFNPGDNSIVDGGDGFNPGNNEGFNPGNNEGFNPGNNEGFNPGYDTAVNLPAPIWPNTMSQGCQYTGGCGMNNPMPMPQPMYAQPQYQPYPVYGGQGYQMQPQAYPMYQTRPTSGCGMNTGCGNPPLLNKGNVAIAMRQPEAAPVEAQPAPVETESEDPEQS